MLCPELGNSELLK